MSVDNPVYVQLANEGEFQRIKHVGPAKASNLVMFREAQGFLDMQDLVQITGINKDDWETMVREGTVVIKSSILARETNKQLQDKIRNLEMEQLRLASENQRWQDTTKLLREQMSEREKMWDLSRSMSMNNEKLYSYNDIKPLSMNTPACTSYSESVPSTLMNTSLTSAGSASNSIPVQTGDGGNSISPKNTESRDEMATPNSRRHRSRKQKDRDYPSDLDTPKSKHGRRRSSYSELGRPRSRRRYHESDYSDSDTSSTSNTETSDSSDWECTRNGERRRSQHRHSKSRKRSPPTPRLPTFNGEGNWDSFLFQFERLADRYRWSDRKARERLLDSLKDKALEFARETGSGDYNKLVRKMTRRFSTKEAPIAARRQLMSVRQKENEYLEEFSQRVHFLCMDGHPDAKEGTIDQISVEAFLRGCKDKEAAKCAMEKNPKDIYKALKYVKASVNNQQALFGSGGRHSYSTKQVSFAEEPEKARYRSASPSQHISMKSEGLSDVQQLVQVVSQLCQKLDNTVKSSTSQYRYDRVSPNRISRSPQRDFSDNDRNRFTRNRSRSITPESPNQTRKLCYHCRKPGHFEANCPQKQRTESLNDNRLSLTAKPQSPNRT